MGWHGGCSFRSLLNPSIHHRELSILKKLTTILPALLLITNASFAGDFYAPHTDVDAFVPQRGCANGRCSISQAPSYSGSLPSHTAFAGNSGCPNGKCRIASTQSTSPSYGVADASPPGAIYDPTFASGNCAHGQCWVPMYYEPNAVVYVQATEIRPDFVAASNFPGTPQTNPHYSDSFPTSYLDIHNPFVDVVSEPQVAMTPLPSGTPPTTSWAVQPAYQPAYSSTVNEYPPHVGRPTYCPSGKCGL